MNYLYGDSTASRLKSNFLEFLRDAIDFCVFVLQADARMKAGRVQIKVLGEESDAESARLDRFITSVSRAVHGGDKGTPDSPTAQCGARLASLIVDAHRSSIDGIRHTLAQAIARIEAEESAGRDACVKALGALLAPHEPPDASTTLKLGLADSGRYDATLVGAAEPALKWTLEIAIPDGHPWSSTMRVERLIPHLEIRAPQLSGWISKEVKVKPQRIERMLITELVDDGETVTFELRTEPASEVGFDFEVDLIDGKVVKSTRVGPADDASVGTFDIDDEDVPVVIDLAKKLRATLGGLERRPNISATFDGSEFRTLGGYVDFVQRLVATMAPIVREISARSLTPNELVLRRALSDDRREEIFVAKATLREKLSVLPSSAASLFASLGLEVEKQKPDASLMVAVPAAPQPSSDRPPIRSELPPSAPPPKYVAPPLAPPRAAPPPPRILSPSASTSPGPVSSASPSPVSSASPSSSSSSSSSSSNAEAPSSASSPSVRTLQPPLGAPAAPPASSPAPLSPPPPPTRHNSDSPQIEVLAEEEEEEEEEAEVEMSSDTLLEELPDSSRSLIKPEKEGPSRNEALVAALKKIMMLSKNGRAPEAYHEYETLFGSDAFANYRLDEQRQALKLMVLARSHPADTETVAAAHRVALTRLLALVEATNEPADQELLGMAHLYLGDEKAAGKAFQAGLDAERIKNPQSELIATLMRRVSQL